ncbi:hypothetical protein CBS101457_003590 [Exobasidium rhododendri]|nr:hypothetical protein CBS101457_003590 [Exobasidium rhododendri]
MSNVLVYSGPGVSSSALSHTLKTLRILLPSYDVQCINAKSLAVDPWSSNASLFVLPGGRDLPYVGELGASHRSSTFSKSLRADERIRDFVQEGGSFLGICAGAYYASSRCEFEEGIPEMQVVGDRPSLQFFPGTCRGTVFPGFVYESDKGARMVELQVEGRGEQAKYTTYYNGGGAFMEAAKYQNRGVKVLSRYISEGDSDVKSHGQIAIKAGLAGQAAVIQCTVGKGHALLFGTHPEFPLASRERPTQLDSAPETMPTDSLDKLEEQRLAVFGEQLQALGLEVKVPASAQESGQMSGSGPKLTPVMLTARNAETISQVLDVWKSVSSSPKETLASFASADKLTSGLCAFADTNDTLHIHSASDSTELFAICTEADYSPYTFPVVASNADEARAGEIDEVEVDLNKVPKYILAVMDPKDDHSHLTPHWDALSFYAYIQEARRRIIQGPQLSWVTDSSSDGPKWGSVYDDVQLAEVSTYAQVVTSTQTMLDKNYKLLTKSPNGFTSFATHQVSGRGRGKNAWISPLGCLQFSTLLHVSPSALARSGTGGIVFVQYLAGLAIVESVRSGILGAEYAAIGEKIRIKWPNDVYAEVSDADEQEGERKGTFAFRGKRYAKMAGVLVNSQFAGGRISLVVGCGINTLNPRPTTSLSDLINAHNSSLLDFPSSRDGHLASISQERFAGAIIATFERMWNTFISAGGSFDPFVDAYRRAWLHSDQVTTLSDTTPPTPVRIVGITSDFGLLRSTPLIDSTVSSRSAGSWASSKQHGQYIDLQPDGNSFDMLQNLIRRKE